MGSRHSRPTRRKPVRILSVVLGLVMVAAALLAVLPGLSGLGGRANASTTTLSGSNGGGQPSVTDAFGAWRGAKDTVVSSFMPHATWADIANPTYGGPDYWKGSTVQASWAVAMIPDSGGSIEVGETGAYNGYFASMGRKLVADGQGNAVIRLGWEMNGTYMLWNGVSDPAAWIGYWRQIVTTMRAVTGSHFLFDWSPGGYTGINTDALYPGDAYVDQVGMSVYDQSWDYHGPSQAVARWNELYTSKYGLGWLVSFAAAHNKPMAFGEWGLTSRCDGTGGDDDPYFIQKMHDFFANNNVAWEAYFNIDMSSCETHSLTAGHFPNAAALYKQLFSQPYAPTVTSTPSPSSSPAPSSSAPVATDASIRFSTSSDRSDPSDLDGAITAGKVYVFVPDVAGTNQVKWYLDGSSTPANTELDQPWDAAGTNGADANPWNLSSIPAGSHTVTAVMTGSYGSKTVKATFYAANILYSKSSDRSNPANLDGATISDQIYAFVPEVPGTTSVAWHLDSGVTSPPTHIEQGAPWDLVGGSTSTADPQLVPTSAAGVHDLIAVLTGSYGTITTSAIVTVP